MMQQKLFFPRQTTSKDHKAENELQTPSASLARNRSRCQWQHPMFPRNTAIEMHVHASQESSEEPLYTEIFRKNAAAQIGPRTRTYTSCKPAQSKCMSTCHKHHQKSHFRQKLTGKMPRPRYADTHFVRACAVETHVKISQEPL